MAMEHGVDLGAQGDGALNARDVYAGVTFGHVRQLDRVLDAALARAWQAGAGPRDGPLVIDIDSFIGEVCSEQKRGASCGYTKKLGYHPIVAVRSDTGEVLHIPNRKGRANTQR
jgi:hypothetical protein